MENNLKKLYVVSGSSGVGKGTVIKELLTRNPDLKLSISCTTRQPRNGEIDGESYFFITEDEFRKCADNNEFLECAEYSNNFYGTKRAFVEKTLVTNDVLLEIDTQGALQVKKLMPEAILIFIAPPSLEDLEFRLRNRKTESAEAIEKRLEFVKVEIDNSKYFDFLVVNDTVPNAVEKIEHIMKTDGVY